jgi:PAS domain-containing protein
VNWRLRWQNQSRNESRAGDGVVARRREQVLFELAKRNKADVAETFRAIIEAAAVALDVERTSVWRLRPDRSAIVFVLDDQGTTVQANPLGARMIEFAGGGTTPAERTELVEFRDEQGRVIPAALAHPPMWCSPPPPIRPPGRRVARQRLARPAVRIRRPRSDRAQVRGAPCTMTRTPAIRHAGSRIPDP